jgi:hypothetical protein
LSSLPSGRIDIDNFKRIDNASARQNPEGSATKTFKQRTPTFLESYCRISELSSITRWCYIIFKNELGINIPKRSYQNSRHDYVLNLDEAFLGNRGAAKNKK